MASIIKVDTIQDQDGNNIISEAANTITIGASGDTITIPSNVGIGTSSPINISSTNLTVSGSASSSLFFEDTGYEASGNGLFSLTYDDGNLKFETASRSGSGRTGNTERMRIDSSGNVGIGTTSPQTELHVTAAVVSGASYRSSAPLTLERNGGVELHMISGDSDYAQIRFGDASSTMQGALQYDHSANDMFLYTAGTERMRIDSSGNLKFNSGYGSVATAYGCRAWVNFNGTGTVAIRESGNVTSITDNGTGNYTVNFTTNMPDANYAWNIGIGRTGSQSGGAVAFTSTAPSAGALRVLRFSEAFTSFDEEFMCVTIFR